MSVNEAVVIAAVEMMAGKASPRDVGCPYTPSVEIQVVGVEANMCLVNCPALDLFTSGGCRPDHSKPKPDSRPCKLLLHHRLGCNCPFVQAEKMVSKPELPPLS